MALDSMQEIFDKAEQGQKPFWRVILDTDLEEREVTEEGSMERMRYTWKAMLESVEKYQVTAAPSADWWAATASVCASTLPAMRCSAGLTFRK